MPDATLDGGVDPRKITHLWHKTFGDTWADFGHGVVVDSKGNVTLTGHFQRTVDPGGGSVTAMGGYDVIVTSFTAAGVHRWQRALGGALTDRGYGVAVDAADNVYITGTFTGTADFGGGDVIAVGDQDMFVTSFSSLGVHRWQQAFGGDGPDYSQSVVVDGDGNVILTGHFEGKANLGGGNVTSKGDYDVFITSFSAAGDHRWYKTFGGTGPDHGEVVRVDASGNITVLGEFSETINLGGGDVTSQGSLDVFVTSFSSAGVHRWQKAFHGASYDSTGG
ncbi:MAG: hypothetical protein JRH20_26400, partial [Deltaproteobacteria bacterium]|nr:hypothetical protein [Deltaproteobacteria bacterium]